MNVALPSCSLDGSSWLVTESLPPTRRGQKTRNDLLHGAAILFRDRRYHDVTVAEVTGASGVSVGVFYRYFESKEDIFTVLLSRVLKEMYEATRAMWRPDVPVLENFAAITLRYLSSYWTNRRVIRSAFELAATSDRVRGMWWSLRADLHQLMLHRLVQDQQLSDLPALDPVITLRALSGMVDEYAKRAFAEEEFGPADEADLRPVADVLATIWFRALFGDDRSHDANSTTSPPSDIGDAEVSRG